jgi:tRNA dimethylallyltransferase
VTLKTKTARRRPAAPPSRTARPAPRAKYPPAILLMGPTASGKTQVAIDLMRELPCEIVSVDSAQVYRHMDIGTAKPDAETLRAAPHHLIDVIEPNESFSAARFRDDAQALMREITERGNIPLLVGGTMMYFKTLLEGLSELPEADPAIRMVIDTMAEESGWPALHAKLKSVDPETAARLAPNDAQRIQRALEVFYITEKPMSDLLKKPKYVYFPYTPIKLALIPGERAVLHQRIATRFETMLELGLIGEVRRLRENYALDMDMPSMRCVGYRQTWQYLDGKIGLAALREQSVAATRQLAKRQLTWLRAMKDVKEFDCLDEELSAQVLEFLRRQLPKKAAAVKRQTRPRRPRNT